jgi:hypothetical protein
MAAGLWQGNRAPTWRQAPIAPPRLRLQATPGTSGASCARFLYQQRRYRRLAPWVRCINSVALRHGVARTASRALPGLGELGDVIGGSYDGAACIRSSGADRLVLALGRRGRVAVVLKVGLSDDVGLQREIDILLRLNSTGAGLMVPSVRWHGVCDGRLVLATNALARRERTRDPCLEDVLQLCLRLTAVGGTRFVVHGDLCPWNMLPTPDGVALVDWETGRFEVDPLYDLSHYVLSVGALLNAYDPSAAVALLVDRRSPGWRYLEALDLDPRGAPDLVARYLQRQQSDTPYHRAVLAELGLERRESRW